MLNAGKRQGLGAVAGGREGISGQTSPQKERKPPRHPEQISCFWTGRWEPGAPPKIRGQSRRLPRLLAEMLSAKAAFTKTCASAAPRASFFDPEHVYFLRRLKALLGRIEGCLQERLLRREKSRLLFELDQEALSKPSEICQLKTGKPRNRMDKKRQAPASGCYESHAQENPRFTSRYLLPGRNAGRSPPCGSQEAADANGEV